MSSMTISGLISGLNTDDLIDQLMAIERRPVTLMEQQQRALSIEKDAYGQIGTSLGTLAGSLETLLNLTTTWDAKKATSSDATIATAAVEPTAAPGTYLLEVTNLAQAHSVASDEQASITAALGYSGTVQVNGKAITIDSTMSLEMIRDEINAADADVKATIVSKSLVLTSKKTGVASAMTFVDGPEGIWKALGVLDAADSIKHKLADPLDAQFKVNGLSLTRDSNTISDVVSGVTFTLLKPGQTTIEVQDDVDSIVTKIKEFVSAYNSTNSVIQAQTGEGATLQGESPITALSRDLRQSITGLVNTGGTYDLLAEVGITADKAGVLTVDETKLRDALAADADAVRNLFTATAAADGFDGIATRASALIDRYTEETTGIIPLRQDMYQDQIDRLDESIEAFDARLEIRRQSLVQRFTQMELALAQMQAMSNALAGQLASLMSLQNTN